MGNCGRNFQTDINETLCDVKLWLVLSILIIAKSMLTNLIKTCRKACSVRDENVTQQQ